MKIEINDFIKIGSSISKAILKFWFKENLIAQGTSEGIIDFLEKKFTDYYDKRRTERFYERISEEISKQLNVFMNKNDKLNDNQKKKLINIVTELVDNTNLNQEILTKTDLNAMYLKEYILSENKYKFNTIDENENECFNEILIESCNYIIEISTTLPDFNEEATKELLRRETKILELVQKIIDNIPEMRISKAPDKDIEFETQYCRRVAQKLDFVELYGVSFKQLQYRYNLSAAYISLKFTSKNTKNHLNDEIRSEDVLNDYNKILITGDPGSGKTTLLQWLAVNSTRSNFIDSLSKWNEFTPFLIRLRNYSSGNFPTPEKFIESVGSNISNYMPQGWVNRKLESGKCLLLFDGVDELPPNIRKKVESWIIDLIDEFPKPIYIVSSRPTAIDENWLADKNFVNYAIQELNRDDVVKFINHWHLAAKDSLVDSNIDFNKYKNILTNLIYDTPSIRNLTTSPLLLAMICALNIDRNTYIPKDRMELYRVVLESLLERRDVDRNIKSHINLSRVEKEILLQHFAYWLLLNNYSDCEINEAIEKIGEEVKSIQNIKNQNNEDIFKELLVRSGLLREPVVGRVNFIHKTFQEYLSAKKAISNNDIGILIEKCESDHWREVIVLSAGHSNMEQRDKLINGLIDYAKNRDCNEKKIKFLALACMETSPQLSQKTEEMLHDVSISLFPPQSLQDAKDLSSIGDGAVFYLCKYHDSKPEIISLCIKSLTYIGTNLALEGISKYSSSNDIKVIKSLLLAWDYFDQEKFAEIIFKNTPFRGPYKVKQKLNFSGFQYLYNLENLELIECSLINISEIGKLQNLKELILKDCTGSRIDPIGEIESLTSITIENCKDIEDYTFLENLVNLEYLNLSGNIEFTDISIISDLTSLVYLNLEGCYGITDICDIENLINLKKLILPELSMFDELSEDFKCNVDVE